MRQLTILLFFLCVSTAFGQRIQDFNVYDAGNGSVAVRFVVSAGPACYGYDVMHSTDSITYNSVYNFAEQCGFQSQPSPQSWTHSSPVFNQTNYYKIQMLNPYETSVVRRLYVTQPGRSQTIPFPNPVFGNTDRLSIKTVNSGDVRMAGFLYNQFGTVMQELDVTAKQDLATIEVGGLSDGLYVVWLTDGNNLYSCKFIVKR